MGTRQLPENEWSTYFDLFTQQHLKDARPETVTLEVLGGEDGDQIELRDKELRGLTYDRKSALFEVLVDDVDHLSFHPKRIWAVEEDDGFLSSVELEREDGRKEVLRLQRSQPETRAELPR